jgi:hypothetical protein
MVDPGTKTTPFGTDPCLLDESSGMVMCSIELRIIGETAGGGRRNVRCPRALGPKLANTNVHKRGQHTADAAEHSASDGLSRRSGDKDDIILGQF